MSAAFDQAALERLYVRLEAPLYNVVYRWLWKSADAHDVVQEAFMRVWAMRERVRPETVEPLVYRIALNLAASRRRSKRLWGWVTFAEAPEEGTESSEARLLSAEATQALRRAMDGLPEAQRQAIALCELAEMSYDEAARVLEIPVGTVASRRHLAMRKLEAALAAWKKENDDV